MLKAVRAPLALLLGAGTFAGSMAVSSKSLLVGGGTFPQDPPQAPLGAARVDAVGHRHPAYDACATRATTWKMMGWGAKRCAPPPALAWLQGSPRRPLNWPLT